MLSPRVILAEKKPERFDPVVKKWSDPDTISDRRLKQLICDAGGVHLCPKCEVYECCRYGRELVRRAEKKKAERMKEAQAAPKEKPAFGKWVRVDDRLPDGTCSTLICTETGAVCQARYYAPARKWSGYAGKNAVWWMPLPEGPKEAGK